MNKIWVITPSFEKRESLLKVFVEFLTRTEDLQVLGSGNNGITISAPGNYSIDEIRHHLPKQHANDYFVEEAETPVLMSHPIRRRMRR
jgi:hypothetical protein